MMNGLSVTGTKQQLSVRQTNERNKDVSKPFSFIEKKKPAEQKKEKAEDPINILKDMCDTLTSKLETEGIVVIDDVKENKRKLLLIRDFVETHPNLKETDDISNLLSDLNINNEPIKINNSIIYESEFNKMEDENITVEDLEDVMTKLSSLIFDDNCITAIYIAQELKNISPELRGGSKTRSKKGGGIIYNSIYTFVLKRVYNIYTAITLRGIKDNYNLTPISNYKEAVLEYDGTNLVLKEINTDTAIIIDKMWPAYVFKQFEFGQQFNYIEKGPLFITKGGINYKLDYVVGNEELLSNIFTPHVIGSIPQIFTSSFKYPCELFYILNINAENILAIITQFYPYYSLSQTSIFENTLNLGNGYVLKQGGTMYCWAYSSYNLLFVAAQLYSYMFDEDSEDIHESIQNNFRMLLATVLKDPTLVDLFYTRAFSIHNLKPLFLEIFRRNNIRFNHQSGSIASLFLSLFLKNEYLDIVLNNIRCNKDDDLILPIQQIDHLDTFTDRIKYILMNIYIRYYNENSCSSKFNTMNEIKIEHYFVYCSLNNVAYDSVSVNTHNDYISNIKQIPNSYYVKKPLPKGDLYNAFIDKIYGGSKVSKQSVRHLVRKERFKDNRIRNVYKIGRTLHVNYKGVMTRYQELKENKLCHSGDKKHV
jgi:hypothetical protein